MGKTLTGFRREHFECFRHTDDADARRRVRERMADFAEQVRARVHPLEPFYEVCEIGGLKGASTECWAAFGPHDYRHVTHQTIALGSEGLRVLVNAELKSATERVKSVISHHGDALRAAFMDMHSFKPFDLVLEERIQRVPKVFDYIPQIRLDSARLIGAETGDIAWRDFTQAILRLPLPYLHIDRLLPPSKLIEPVGPDAIQQVVEILHRNHAVVSLMNG